MAMEVSGAKTLLEFLLSKGIQVDTFATDRSSSIRWNIIGINHGIFKFAKTYQDLNVSWVQRYFTSVWSVALHQGNVWDFGWFMYDNYKWVYLCWFLNLVKKNHIFWINVQVIEKFLLLKMQILTPVKICDFFCQRSNFHFSSRTFKALCGTPGTSY